LDCRNVYVVDISCKDCAVERDLDDVAHPRDSVATAGVNVADAYVGVLETVVTDVLGQGVQAKSEVVARLACDCAGYLVVVADTRGYLTKLEDNADWLGICSQWRCMVQKDVGVDDRSLYTTVRLSRLPIKCDREELLASVGRH